MKVERVYEIRDLGVIINAKMNPNAHFPHIEFIRKKSLAALSFVRRTCRNKFHLDTAKLLYTSLVRSNVEFANVVWNPHTKEQRKSIESVQKQAVMYLHGDYLTRGIDNNYALTQYDVRSEEVGLTKLIRRRINASAP